MTGNAELITALRGFWPHSDQEAVEFLEALRECVDGAMENDAIGPDTFERLAEVGEALDAPGPGPMPASPRARLLDAAGRGGVTIGSAARLLGVSRWRARQLLGKLRDEGALRVHSQGRASRWLRTGTGSAA